MPNSARPPSRRQAPVSKDFLKRRTFAEGQALADAAHLVTHRLYCDTLGLWRRCARKACRRHRRCKGEPTGWLVRGLPSVPQAERGKAQQAVIAGGPRRIPPATHMEWAVRQTTLETLLTWGFG